MSIFIFIKNKISILDVVQEYATLKRLGSYWKGYCPLHLEKTASFTVSPHREIYYCFGCAKGGDVIDFIAAVERCSPLEAVHHLAERYGIELPKDSFQEKLSNNRGNKLAYFKACSVVAEWCQQQLKEESQARSYLENRAVVRISQESFGVGYFPSGARAIKSLLHYAQQEAVTAHDLLEARILLEGKQLYSPFEDRIIFPIADQVGRICGFGARIFRQNDERPKYYNSHDHEFFTKGLLLFGLDKAKKSIQDQGSVFLVEGYTDCIAMVQAGLSNTVATLGTACTVEHLKLLARYAQEVYVVYDGDAAGQKAIIRLTQLCWQVNLELLVVTLPEKEDPASFLQRGGNLGELKQGARNIYQFFIEYVSHGIETAPLQTRLSSIKQLLSVIQSLDDPIKQDMLLQKIAENFQIPFQTLKNSLQSTSNGEKNKVGEDQHKKIEERHTLDKPEVRLKEVSLLNKSIFCSIITHYAMLMPEDVMFVIERLGDPLGVLLHRFFTYHQENKQAAFSDFFQVLNEYEKYLISSINLQVEESGSGDFSMLFEQFKKREWKTIVRDFKLRLAVAHQSCNEVDAHEILNNFQKLKQKFIFKGAHD
jgi:DNA primase